MTTNTKFSGFLTTIEGCSFCEELNDPQKITPPIVKNFFQDFEHSTRIFLETERAFAVPSLGAIMPGHVLLLPKSHFYSVGELKGADLIAFESLALKLQRTLKEVYGCCSAFEHGCVAGAGKAGACIDHAHLHLLPLKTDLTGSIARKFGQGKEIRGFSDLGQLVARRIPYLYYQAPNGSAHAYEAPQAPSQFFRQLVCSVINAESVWDWKKDLRTAVVEETYRTLRDALSEEQIPAHLGRS